MTISFEQLVKGIKQAHEEGGVRYWNEDDIDSPTMLLAMYKALGAPDFKSIFALWSADAKKNVVQLSKLDINSKDQNVLWQELRAIIEELILKHANDPNALDIVFPNQSTISDLLASSSSVDKAITSVAIVNGKSELSGSLRNWISIYRTYGQSPRHSNIERMNFLHKSENTKKLSDQDRARLAVVLKAHDDGGNVPVNSKTGEILFSRIPVLDSSTKGLKKSSEDNQAYQGLSNDSSSFISKEIPKLEVDRSHEQVTPSQAPLDQQKDAPVNLAGKQTQQQEQQTQTSENHVVDLKNMK